MQGMAKTTSLTDAKKRARALVAQVKDRVARQEGTPADMPADDEGDGAPRPAKSHVTRAQAMGKAPQRSQGAPRGK